VSTLRRVARGVFVATSRNDTTNSVVVTASGTDAAGAVLLVDPAWDADELGEIAGELVRHRFTVVAGLSTHAHFDHLLWHPGFGPAPRWASPATVARAIGNRESLLRELGDGYPDDILDLFARVEPVGAAEAMLPWTGQPVELVVHDAHVPGHTAAWIPGPGVLIAGDLLSDIEPPLPHDEPGVDAVAALRDYAAGLEILAPYVARATLVIPGHGSETTDGLSRWEADRRAVAALRRVEHPPRGSGAAISSSGFRASVR
jgi:hydroxyacylglutathione hydrolase